MTRRLDEREVPHVQGSCIAFRGERECRGVVTGRKLTVRVVSIPTAIEYRLVIYNLSSKHRRRKQLVRLAPEEFYKRKSC